MAKRFGRNQRRKMLALIAEKDAQKLSIERAANAIIDARDAHIKKLEGMYRRLNDEMIDWARRILIQLGDDTAFARTFKSEVADEWMIKMLMEPMGWQKHVPDKLSMDWRGPSATMESTAIRVVRLFPMFVDHIDEIHRMQRIIQWRVGPDDHHQLYYAIDLRTIQEIGKAGENHPLVRHMLRLMVEALQSAWAPKPPKKELC